jgi:hypothetical protein
MRTAEVEKKVFWYSPDKPDRRRGGSGRREGRIGRRQPLTVSERRVL